MVPKVDELGQHIKDLGSFKASTQKNDNSAAKLFNTVRYKSA